jgi:hypothetical protein
MAASDNIKRCDMRVTQAIVILVLSVFPALISSCGGARTFTEITLDTGVTIGVEDGWLMTIRSSDKSAFEHRLSGQPEYVFAPITCAQGDPTATDLSNIRNWRFIGLKGEFDPKMNPMTSEYPVPEGLYFVGPLKGELVDEYSKKLDWTGAEEVDAVFRLYEETHGTGAFTDLWHAYTVTFNYDGNAYEFNMRIPSEVDTQKSIYDFSISITKLEFK